MTGIRIQTPSQTWTSELPRAFVVGRDTSCDIVVSEPSVSRRHAEIRAVGAAWEVVDLGSSAGTWVGAQRVTQARLEGTTVVRLGEHAAGTELTVTVIDVPSTAVTDRPAVGGGQPGTPPPGLDMTMLPNVGFPGSPGGGPELLVRLRSGDRSFPAHQPVRLGRDPGLEVVAENPSVSRLHAVVEPRPGGWWLVDRSTAGTFVDGERITDHAIEGPTTVLLGHPTAGYEVELVPVVAAGVASAGIARRKRNRTLAIVGAAAAVLLVVGGGVAAGVVLGGGDGDDDTAGRTRQAVEGGQGLSQAELDRAKAATVFLVAYGPDGSPVSAGSGSIISDDGLVLSNAHVANPAAPGMDGAEVDFVEVYFTTPDDDDAPVELRYLADPIVSDGYLDVTVAQITADADGAPVDQDALDLPEPLPLGDSDELRTLDEITALGYPDLSRVGVETEDLPTLTVTKGTVAAFNSSTIIDSDRAEIDADLRIGSGNSGGPSINESGEIIGLNTRVVTEASVGDSGAGGSFTGGSARVVPINLAEVVLDIAENGGDPSYVSPYLEALPDPEEEMVSATIAQHGWVPEGEQGTCSGTSTFEQPQIVSVAPGDVVHAEFVVTGLADGTPLDFVLFTFDGATELQRDPITWDAELDGECIFVTYTVPEGIPGINAVPQIGEQFVVDNPLQFQ